MPGLIGIKKGMTNIFTDDGRLIPVSVIETGPCYVYKIRTIEKDGYEAIQMGFGSKKKKKVNKAQLTEFKNLKLNPPRKLKEFRNFDVNTVKPGDEIKVDIFSEGDMVKVSGISKGKGFQGVMRRHGFGGVGGATHGQKDRLRHPGSIGQSSYPSRVLKGTKMAGRMGGDQVTTKGLKIIKIIEDKNIIMVKGAIPGAVNSIVEINK